MDIKHNETHPNNAQHLTTLRKRATEYLLQSNYKIALPVYEETLKFISDNPNYKEELKLNEDDLYVLNCARCLCYLHDDIEKAEEILHSFENKFNIKLPLLYFIFTKEFFKKNLLKNVKDYATKFLNAYRTNVFNENGKVYYWFGNSIPIKYEQFNCSISDLVNEVIEQLKWKNKTDEDTKCLTEIFTILEEVLFYTQTEDCIRNSYKKYENTVSGSLSNDKSNNSVFCNNKYTDLKNVIDNKQFTNMVNENVDSYKNENSYTQIKHADKQVQTKIKNVDATTQIDSTTSQFLYQINKSIQTKIINADVCLQTFHLNCDAESQTEQDEVLSQLLLIKMGEEQKKYEAKIECLEQQLEAQMKLFTELEMKCNKMKEENLIELTKWEVRFEILQNDLTKLQEKHENDLKQIAMLQTHLQNEYNRNAQLQKNIYSQYEKKCNNMVKDLNGIMQYLTPCSLPTSFECKEELRVWNDELCKATFCKNLVDHFQKELLAKFINFDYNNLPTAPDIPDCPIEPRDLLHDNFKPTILNIIKSEHSSKQMNYKPLQIPQFQSAYMQGQNLMYHLLPTNLYPVMPYTNQFLQTSLSSNSQSLVHKPQVQQPPIQPPKFEKKDDNRPLSQNSSTTEKFDGISNDSVTDVFSIDWSFKPETQNKNLSSSSSESLLEIDNITPPLSTIVKIGRKKNCKDNDENLLNLNKLSEAVQAMGDKKFQTLYLYIKKHLPNESEEKLLNAIKTIKNENNGKLTNLKKDDILNKIKNYFQNKNKESIKIAWNSIQNTCNVCKNNLQETDKTTTLECQHVFHANCIKTWLEGKNFCPNCKCHVIVYDEYPPLKQT